jgi:hypothetical protein
MSKEELRNKLHKYIDEASEEQLEDMLSIVQESETEYKLEGKRTEWWEDEEFIKELDRRLEEIDSGKVRAIPADEAHKEVFEMIANMKRK